MNIVTTKIAAGLLFAALLLAAGPARSDSPLLGTLPTLVLPDPSGAPQAIPSPDHALTVLVFVTPDCPVANRYTPVLNELAAQWKDEDVAFFRVYSDPDVQADAIARHTAEYALQVPALLDKSTTCARQTGAEITPEAVVLGKAGEIYYRGRIDDRYIDFGKYRSAPTQHDLKDAVDAARHGKTLPENDTRVIGCYIPLTAPETREEGAP